MDHLKWLKLSYAKLTCLIWWPIDTRVVLNLIIIEHTDMLLTIIDYVCYKFFKILILPLTVTMIKILEIMVNLTVEVLYLIISSNCTTTECNSKRITVVSTSKQVSTYFNLLKWMLLTEQTSFWTKELKLYALFKVFT